MRTFSECNKFWIPTKQINYIYKKWFKKKKIFPEKIQILKNKELNKKIELNMKFKIKFLNIKI